MFALPSIPASKLNKPKEQVAESKEPQLPDETPKPDERIPETTESQAFEREAPPPVAYDPPPWSGLCMSNFWFEVLKEGTIAEEIPIKKPFVVFGRLPTCDVILNHASISRYHAILQCRKDDRIFIYDMGSTHKTFLNKKSLIPKKYTEVRPGIYFDLGAAVGSTQAVHGGDFLGFMGIRRGCVDPEQNDTEDFDIADPQKAVKNWMEQNGQEIPIEFSEDGRGIMKCHVATLQITTDSYSFTCEGRGARKKEAERECWIDACRRLHAAKLITRTGAKVTVQRKVNQDEDLSDEDSFYDRTGSSERKKKKESTGPTSETFESLLVKFELAKENIALRQTELAALADAEAQLNAVSAQDEDDLDSYVRSLDQKSSRKAQEKLFSELSDMKKELSRTYKLLKLIDSERALKLNPDVETTKPVETLADTPKTTIMPPVPGKNNEAPTVKRAIPEADAESEKNKRPKLEAAFQSEVREEGGSMAIDKRRVEPQPTGGRKKKSVHRFVQKIGGGAHGDGERRYGDAVMGVKTDPEEMSSNASKYGY
ncbi:hypothetical protein BC829DRAFT_406795 [Chytridium lagenaria]|nr:hypothetical protein BC829DRAFT_406795 [Chytridium lagenaria]